MFQLLKDIISSYNENPLLFIEFAGHVKSCLTGRVVGQITSRKRVGAQNRKHPNRDMQKMSKSWNNVQSNFNWKKNREKNLYIDMHINLSSCKTSDYNFSLSRSKMTSCSLPEIIQIGSLSWLQKKTLVEIDCLYVACASERRVRNHPT